jgi:hypothetical protein
MARPRIFVSSTYYDLKHLRSSLENFIESLGYDAILSEKGDIAYSPDTALDESCYREVRNADVFVMIIGGRYGSEKSGSDKDLPKSFFDRYDSITKQEYKSASNQDIPIYVLIERSVYADFENFLRNKDNREFSYAHVDSVNIFHLIEDILAQRRNNPVQQFDRYSDIESWLRDQWAGLFREMLSRLSSQQQIASLASQVTELAEINKTLKTYLEEVVSKIAPEESAQLIKSESKRLKEAQQLAKIESEDFVKYLRKQSQLSSEEIYEAITASSSAEDFVQQLESSVSDAEFKEEVRSWLDPEWIDFLVRDLNRLRQMLDLSPLPDVRKRSAKRHSASKTEIGKEKLEK